MSSRIVILGSCSGTEPYTGRHHTSWVLETEQNLYWFDAGECCAYTAYVGGLDVRKSRAVFISHPHSDHIGGLLNMLTCIRKMRFVADFRGKLPEIFTPVPAQAEKIFGILEDGEERLADPPKVTKLLDGIVFQNEELTVEARHNTHMNVPADGNWKSFSFRIHSPFGTIVSSGDVGTMDELDDWIPGADLFLMETGHHDPAEVCRTLAKCSGFKGRLVFFHHGRRILNAEGDSLWQECCSILGRDVTFASDSQVLAGDPLPGHALIHK